MVIVYVDFVGIVSQLVVEWVVCVMVVEQSTVVVFVLQEYTHQYQ